MIRMKIINFANLPIKEKNSYFCSEKMRKRGAFHEKIHRERECTPLFIKVKRDLF